MRGPVLHPVPVPVPALVGKLRTRSSCCLAASLHRRHPLSCPSPPGAIRYHLCRMLQVNKALASLNLSKHKVVDFGAELLAEHLEGSATLFSLALRRYAVRLVAGVAARAVAARVFGRAGSAHNAHVPSLHRASVVCAVTASRAWAGGRWRRC